MKLDFYPHEWDRLYNLCGFTEEQIRIIELRRKRGSEWTNERHASELHMSLSGYKRRKKAIEDKIAPFVQ